MDTQDIINATKTTERLIQNSDYYKFIFKKTEKIVSVVFYITHNLSHETKSDRYVEDIETTAREVHNVVLESLNVRAHVAEDSVRAAAHMLVTLDSKLRVAHTTGIISAEVLQVLINEIDAVLRGMNKYLDMPVLGMATAPAVTPASAAKKTSVSRPTATPAASAAAKAESAKPHRRDRILTVLEAKGEASIKDISEIITDVSEKTIQRELNAMIEDNLVKRHGERRWSKYSVF